MKSPLTITVTAFDVFAARYLLRGDTETLKRLAHDAAVAAGEECPHCGNRETESNGYSEYRCCGCDHRWGTEYGEQYGY